MTTIVNKVTGEVWEGNCIWPLGPENHPNKMYTIADWREGYAAGLFKELEYRHSYYDRDNGFVVFVWYLPKEKWGVRSE